MSSELRVDKIIPTSGVPTGGGGGIIQIKQTYKTDVYTVNAQGTHDITGLNVTITPKFATSKILIMCDICGHAHNGMGGAFKMRRTVSGTATILGLADSAGNRQVSSFTGHLFSGDEGSAGYRIETATARILDSPNTTSQITYQVTVSTIEASLYCINRSENDLNNNDHCRNVSSITVMEVSA